MDRLCDSCGKPLRSKYGMDLSDNLYCRRVLCKLTIKINKITISNQTKQIIAGLVGISVGVLLVVIWETY